MGNSGTGWLEPDPGKESLRRTISTVCPGVGREAEPEFSAPQRTDSALTTGSASPQVLLLCPLNTEFKQNSLTVIPCWPETQRSPALAFQEIRCVHHTGLGPLLGTLCCQESQRSIPQSQVNMAVTTSVACLPATSDSTVTGTNPISPVVGRWRVGKGGSGRVWACLHKQENLMPAMSLSHRGV